MREFAPQDQVLNMTLENTAPLNAVVTEMSGDRVLLLWGGASAISKFCQTLRNLIDRNVEAALDLKALGLIRPAATVDIIVEVSSRPLGAKLIRDNLARWTVDRSTIFDFAAKLETLQSSEGPAHQYLEIPGDDILVCISKDEYPDDFFGAAS